MKMAALVSAIILLLFAPLWTQGFLVNNKRWGTAELGESTISTLSDLKMVAAQEQQEVQVEGDVVEKTAAQLWETQKALVVLDEKNQVLINTVESFRQQMAQYQRQLTDAVMKGQDLKGQLAAARQENTDLKAELSVLCGKREKESKKRRKGLFRRALARIRRRTPE